MRQRPAKAPTVPSSTCVVSSCDGSGLQLCSVSKLALIVVLTALVAALYPIVTGPDVQRIDALGSRDHSFYAKLAKGDRPVLLRDAITEKWRARKTWTFDRVTTRLPFVPVYRQHQPVFTTFHDGKPMESLVTDVSWAEVNTQLNVSSRLVLEPRNKEEYLYFTHNVFKLPDPEAWLDDISPLSPLQVGDEGLQVNIWMGRKGIVTAGHYDNTYNFFLQLIGRKRFVLYPPSSNVYLYPVLHPHYCHSQVDLGAKEHNRTRYPRFSQKDRLIVELEPGDVLVLPPLWLHHVETLEASLSVNVWTFADDYNLIEQVYRVGIPFENDWNVSEMARASFLFLNMLVQAIFSDQEFDGASAFLQFLHEQRYQALYETGRLREPNSTSSDVLKTLCSSDGWVDSTALLSGTLAAKFDARKQEIADLFKQMQTMAARRVFFGNYVEHLLNVVLGTEQVITFLRLCRVAHHGNAVRA